MGGLPKLEQIFEDGVSARAGGTPACDNPYGPGTAERAEWAAGWSATPDLDEDIDPASDRDQSKTGSEP